MSDTVSSEEEIIARYFAPLASGSPGAFGLKDDCAVIRPAAGEDLVVTVDAVAAGVHFLDGSAPEDVAWRALAVNVSDLAAKGAKPLGYVMSIAFPSAPERAWLAAFAGGLKEAQAAFGIELLGGDTDRRPGPLSITITTFGSVASGTFVQRTTARAGDRVFLSGTLGDAALGLKLEEAPHLAGSWGLDAAAAEFLRLRYRRPEPRTRLRNALIENASAAMDVSDGLAKDLARMCAASAVSARVQVDRLPLSAAARSALANDGACLQTIVSGGDDYEILAAVPENRCAAFIETARREGIAVTDIGNFAPGSDVDFIRSDGSTLELAQPGWDHFLSTHAKA